MNLVTIITKDGGVSPVRVMLDTTPTQLTGGYGGWTTVTRQRRKALTQWQGNDPIRMQIAVLFDSWASRDSQEIPISRLSRMSLPPLDGDEPPVVQIQRPAQGVPDPGPIDWVIENLQWGTNVIWDFSQLGVYCRMRQDCVINLLEYIAPDRVAFANISPGAGAVTGVGGSSGSSSGWPKQYLTKSGDTLQKIAASFYGDSTKYTLIAKANSIRDSKNLAPNTLLTIPKPT